MSLSKVDIESSIKTVVWTGCVVCVSVKRCSFETQFHHVAIFINIVSNDAKTSLKYC